MKPVKAASPESQPADQVAYNIQQLKALFPELITEVERGAVVDVDVLKALVGDASVTDAVEKFGLNWQGKRRARQLSLTSSTATLRPCPEDSAQWDAAENLMIEGDNLEVLKLLQKSYSSKVKLIYIDPPYNTGRDFVYRDDFQEGIRNYLELTGQTEDGRKVSSRAEVGGRFHTDWLNMMYPRLRLARSLLRSDGVIFISIDQGELASLRMMMDEIFGEENFVNIFSWVRTRTPAALSQKTKNVVEYVVCYERSRTNNALLGIEKPAQSANTLLNQPNAVGILTFPAGTETGISDGVTLCPGSFGSSSYVVELLDEVVVRNGRFESPFRLKGRFRWSQAYMDEQVANGTKVRVPTEKLLPSYEKASYGREALPNLIDENVGVGTNESAGQELDRLMGERIFDYPKPLSLLQYLINSCTSADDTVLDFFAGSGTTGHAVMKQNAVDGGRRKFILVQLPEVLPPGGSAESYCKANALDNTISALTRERLRRAAAEIGGEANGSNGFRAFKLDVSNIKAWNLWSEDVPEDLLSSIDRILPDRSDEDVIFEIILKRGLPLTASLERRIVAGAKLYATVGGELMACMAKRITCSEVDSLATSIVDWHSGLTRGESAKVFFLDSAFSDDVAKINMSQILEQAGLGFQSV